MQTVGCAGDSAPIIPPGHSGIAGSQTISDVECAADREHDPVTAVGHHWPLRRTNLYGGAVCYIAAGFA